MKCLIIAAGKGERMRGLHASKPLLPLAGRPLVEHVMRAALSGGATAFVVVTGYLGERVRAFLDGFSERTGVPVDHVVNDAWDRPNGLSVAAARAALDAPFLLTMADHLFDPGIVRGLLAQDLRVGEAVLAVDRDLANPLVDLDDVTRVQLDGDRIRRLGKGLDPYDAFDTGLFYATPALFDALAEHAAPSLSDGMNTLARAHRARAFEVGGRFWLDVDDPRAARLAEERLAGV